MSCTHDENIYIRRNADRRAEEQARWEDDVDAILGFVRVIAGIATIAFIVIAIAGWVIPPISF